MTQPLKYLMLLAALLLATGAAANDKLRIFTVNYPLAYFAERIAGDLAEVEFPAPAGVDPAFWMPDTATIGDYQRADLILLNGAGYAHWASRVSLPGFRSVDTSRAFRDRYIQVEQTSGHSHGPSGEHDHGGTAFTTWLDLAQAAQQAEAIALALRRKRPDQADAIDNRLKQLRDQLVTLDQRLRNAAAASEAHPVLASHPVYQYLARRYSLNLRSVTWEPDQMPDAAQWAQFEQILTEHPARWMIWEAEPAPEIVARLRRLRVEAIVFDPSANRPEQGDFLATMSSNAKRLMLVFQ